jgi:hypothetical protein
MKDRKGNELNEGDSVMVYPHDGNLATTEFQGKILEIVEKKSETYAVVIDQEDDVFDSDSSEIELVKE